MGSSNIKKQIVKSFLSIDFKSLEVMISDFKERIEDADTEEQEECDSLLSFEDVKKYFVNEKNWKRVYKFKYNEKEIRIFQLKNTPLICMADGSKLIFNIDCQSEYDIGDLLLKSLENKIKIPFVEKEVSNLVCEGLRAFLGELILAKSLEVQLRERSTKGIAEMCKDLASFTNPANIIVDSSKNHWEADFEEFLSDGLGDTSFRLILEENNGKLWFEFNED